MEKMMRTAVLRSLREMAIESRPIPQIKPGEVLIRVQAAGVCGSDLHYYEDGRIGDIQVKYPFILGHEIAGVVEAAGEGVESPALGTRVAVEPGIPCGTCEFCRTGRYSLCPEVRFLATPPVEGAFCEYLAYPAQWVYPLPDSMSAVEGALIEPLAVAMHAAEISGAQLGDSAFIFGCGCIGLLTLLVLKSRGVSEIYMCDVIQSRMEKARELGASRVFHGGREKVGEEIQKATKGRGVDCVFEVTGSQACLGETAEVMRKGGTVVLVGLGPESVMDYDFGKLIWKEGQIRTCFRYRNLYPKAIRAISSGKIPVEAVVSHRVGITELPGAMHRHMEQKQEIIKMVVDFETISREDGHGKISMRN